jgi:hypothetical protein
MYLCEFWNDFWEETFASVQNSRWLTVAAGGAPPMVSNSQEKATTPQTNEREFWAAKKSMPVV